MNAITAIVVFYWLLIQLWYAVSLINLFQLREKSSHIKKSDFNVFRRLDRPGRWSDAHVHILSSFVLLPVRFAFILTLCVVIFGLLKISFFLVKNETSSTSESVLRTQFLLDLTKQMLQKCMGIILFLFGVDEVRMWEVNNARLDNVNEDTISITQIDPSTISDIPKNYVSNHVSYLDIIFMIAYLFPSFVSKVGVKRALLVGSFAELLNCVFVTRGSNDSAAQTALAISSRQREIWSSNYADAIDTPSSKLSPFFTPTGVSRSSGKSMVIFPEGTTSNGSTILPFKTGAFRSFTPVTPIVLVYRGDFVSYAYDSIPFAYLFPLITGCAYEGLLDVYILSEVIPTIREVTDNDVKQFSERVQRAMYNVLRCTASSQTQGVKFEDGLKVKAEFLTGVYNR